MRIVNNYHATVCDRYRERIPDILSSLELNTTLQCVIVNRIILCIVIYTLLYLSTSKSILTKSYYHATVYGSYSILFYMFTNGSSKLTPKERKELMLSLCYALSGLNSPEDVAEVLSDLFTPKEVETISKRLKIAQLLVKGEDYETIRSELKVGFSTIARINTWLNLSDEGFKLMFARQKKIPKSPKSVGELEKYDPFSWQNIKRRYSSHFGLELVLDQILKQSDNNQRNKISKIFDTLEFKGKITSGENNKNLYTSFESKLKPVK